MRHEVKSWVGLYAPIAAGLKTHDFRVNDRDYEVGDELLLREYDPLEMIYTGRETLAKITYITVGHRSNDGEACAFSPFAMHPAMVILSIKLIATTANRGSDEDSRANPD